MFLKALKQLINVISIIFAVNVLDLEVICKIAFMPSANKVHLEKRWRFSLSLTMSFQFINLYSFINCFYCNLKWQKLTFDLVFCILFHCSLYGN